ncbi:MAG: beta-N-acetylhexosaminidase [Candidatus Heimdallarchaeota archaeon]
MNGSKKEILSLIPKPIVVNRIVGFFNISEDFKIYSDTKLLKSAKYIQGIFFEKIGWEIPIVKDRGKDNFLSLELIETENLPYDGYHIKVDLDEIYISAKQPIGIFYGMQTLRQLLIKEESNKGRITWKMPCVIIKDYPRFEWRGFMLDEARHFMGKEIVKHLLDLMAYHKLNKFHWHLVDDQGWRIEINKYPKLTEIGSKRKLVEKRDEKALTEDSSMYGGFYTQEDIKEIVAYATDLFIEVIPEIEMPGHCSATLAAYPELSCTGGPFEVPTRWGIFKEVYCPGKDNVYEFLENVLEEVLEMFPSEIIHIGGDEVFKARWKRCPDCKTKMAKEKLSSVKELQPHLTNYFAKYLASKGRRLMGWNQILNDDLLESAVNQFWVGKRKRTLSHLRKGRKTVMTNYLQTYLDHPYKIISLKKAYEFEPIPDDLELEYHSNVLGLEAPLWTERVVSLERLHYQVFPRLTAYAETAWTPNAQKNFKRFIARLIGFMKQLEDFGVKNTLTNINYD